MLNFRLILYMEISRRGVNCQPYMQPSGITIVMFTVLNDVQEEESGCYRNT